MSSILKVDTIQDSGGNAIITSDGSGNLTTLKTNNPSFFVRKFGDQSLSSDTDTKMLPDDVVYDTDNAFNTSTGRFTVPTGKGGKYFLSYGFSMQNLDDNKAVAVSIKVNGSFLETAATVLAGSYAFINSAHSAGSNSDDPSVATSAMVSLSASDYVEMWGRQRNSASENARFLHFGAFRIGD